jgi:hypothetical protein
MRLVKTQNPEFYRDEDTNALINTNASAYKLYKQQRADRNKVSTMQQEIDELKALVAKLLEDKHG